MYNSTSDSVSDGLHFDVVVCGGGCAGWVAASAAAKCGAHTALIERLGFLGGIATSGLVVPISGFYKNGRRVVGGIAYDFVKELESLGAACFEMPKGHVSVDTEYYKLIAQRTILDSGAELFTNSYICGVEADNGKVLSVSVANKNGIERISGEYFVDATGDGDVCAMAGLPIAVNSAPQPMSLCFELSGVDCSTELLKNSIHHNGKNGSHSCNSAIREYLNEEYEQGGPQFGGPWFNTMLRGDALAVNVTRSSGSILNAREYTAAECKLREDMFCITELLREKFPEFRTCHISASAINAGVRESRHLVGAYTLKGEDLMKGTKFADTVALCSHPMDIHKASSVQQELKEFESAGSIPYRCIYADSFSNILAAGRIVSADADAYASVRVQATCMALGQAAGTAAALCLKEKLPVSELPISLLKETLIKDGVVI